MVFQDDKKILTNKSIRRGVTTIPRKLPNAELNIAAASLPPTVLVKITADDTGGGKHARTCNLCKN